jgi:putative peptide zinc metalloprotease protein
MKDTPASDLERRKKVRLRVRPDLVIAPQKYEGRTYYVIKDPVSLRYYRFKEQEHFLIRMMDGGHTLDDAQKAFEKRFRPDRLTLEDLEHFGQQLLTAGLAQNESPQAGKQLFDRRKKRRRSEWMQALTNILYIKIPVFDPERLLGWMLNTLGPALNRIEKALFWTFTLLLCLTGLVAAGTHLAATYGLIPAPVTVPWITAAVQAWGLWAGTRLILKTLGLLVFSVLIMLAAVLLVLTHFQTFLDRLPAYHEFFSFKTVMYLWLALGIVKVIHEFGHGLSCKAFGGEVHEMGFLILCFSPCMYCNVSDAWTLPSKWKRILISFAGIYVELMIAAIATFVWWNSPAQPFVNHLALALMVVCSVSTVFFNGNPLMRYDGYYVLADWLEIPNLRDRSNRYLSRLVMEHCLGIEVQPEPYMELWRRILFVTYAVVSYVYRWVITFVILKFMATFLKPYKLEIISNMLALLAAASMVGWPLFRLGKNIHKRGRLPDMKPVRVAVSASILAAVILAFFFLPIPYSRVRQSGLIQVQPGELEKVPVVVMGSRLKSISVKEGQYVRRGAVLAEFDDQQLKEEELKARTALLRGADLAKEYERLLGQATEPRDKDDLKTRKREAESERDTARNTLNTLEEARKKLVLRAPRDGYVMGLPQIDEIGKTWSDRDVEAPFCSIGDPKKLRVLVPLSPSDYELVRDDLRKKENRGERLEVTIRVRGLDTRSWTGKVVHLPHAESKEVPLALTTHGGGFLAVKPGSQSRVEFWKELQRQGRSSGVSMSGATPMVEPQTQVYLVGIEFDRPDPAIAPGALATVKIHVQYRSAAWLIWRWLSETFDLGLI